MHFAVLILCLDIQENTFCITFKKTTGINFFFWKRTTFLIRNKTWGVLSNMEYVKKKKISPPTATHLSPVNIQKQPSFSVIIWCIYLITYQCYFVPLEVCTGVLGEFRQNYSADFWWLMYPLLQAKLLTKGIMLVQSYIKSHNYYYLQRKTGT